MAFLCSAFLAILLASFGSWFFVRRDRRWRSVGPGRGVKRGKPLLNRQKSESCDFGIALEKLLHIILAGFTGQEARNEFVVCGYGLAC